MEQENPVALVLFLFHRAVGNAYRILATAAQKSMITDDNIRLIENVAIEMIDDKSSVPDSLVGLDDGTASNEATKLAKEFFLGVRATLGNSQVH